VASEADGEPGRGIGARLRSAREKKGLTTLQAAEKLHVDARLLESLEAEDFAALAAPVYVRGHLRRYADLIGESPAKLLQLYDDTTHTASPDLTRIARSEPDGDPSRLMVPALLVLVGFALAGILWWVLTLQGARPQPLRGLKPLAADAHVSATAVPAVTATAAPTPAAAPPTASASAGETAATRAGQAQLALKFSAPSWVEVYDAGGRRLLHGVEAADSARTLAGAAPLRVVLGNAPGVVLQVNGQAVALGGLVHHDGSAHILIDGTGRASAARTGVPRG
jgi:cytoskeleton protein RodZ